MSDQRFINAMTALQDIADQVAVPVRGGKQYTMVKDRVEIFRKEFGDTYGIDTKVDYPEGFDKGAAVIAVAHITDKSDHVIATGWAVEFVGSTQMTSASPVEIAETSAIGRALACFGLHGGEYASLNEIEAHDRKADFQRGNGPNRPGPSTVPHGGYGYGGQRSNQPMTDFYVPSDHDAMWLQPEVEVDKIIKQVEEIGTTHELGKYWADLKPFLEGLRQEQPDMIAEIKAAFATAHNARGGTR